MKSEQILSISPGKIILFGEHFVVYGGTSLISAINRTFEITATCLKNLEESTKTVVIQSDLGFKTTIINSKMISFPQLQYSNMANNMAKIIEFLTNKNVQSYGNLSTCHNYSNFKIVLSLKSELPLGGGLGSSSAFCVALVGIVDSFFNLNLDKKSLCDLSIEAEKIINVDTSGADCNICTFGGIGIFNKENGFSKLSFDVNNKLQFLIIDSGISHNTNQMIEVVKRLREKNPSKFDYLFNQYRAIFESAISSLKEGNYNKFGDLMTQNHSLLKDLSVSNPVIDKLVSICNNNEGILGTKITGAGGGGCIISLIDNDKYLKLKALCKKIKKMDLRFFISTIDPIGLRILNNGKN